VVETLSRRELIAIAEKLMSGGDSDASQARRLMQAFEANLPYPSAGELILLHKDEFKSAAELVDFALGREKAKKLSQEELIAVARKLMTADISSEVESERLSRQFNENVPHPDGDGLIFYPQIEFKTPEELVDYALSYKNPKQ